MDKVFLLLITFLFVGCLTNNTYALPPYGASELNSPDKAYTLKLVDTADPWTYKLTILHHGVELAHYHFEGLMLLACWSPSLKFVAMNGHFGIDGYYVCIFSLTDGSIITSHGIVKDPNYDPDSENFPNLLDQAAGQLKKFYPEVDTDQERHGYDSVAYGWKSDHQLSMFHEFGFDNFGTKYNMIIQAFTTWNVSDHGVSFQDIQFRKARCDQYEPMPPEAKKTLDFNP